MGVARAALWLLAVLALPGALLILQPRSAAFAHSAVVAHEQTARPQLTAREAATIRTRRRWR